MLHVYICELCFAIYMKLYMYAKITVILYMSFNSKILCLTCMFTHVELLSKLKPNTLAYHFLFYYKRTTGKVDLDCCQVCQECIRVPPLWTGLAVSWSECSDSHDFHFLHAPIITYMHVYLWCDHTCGIMASVAPYKLFLRHRW